MCCDVPPFLMGDQIAVGKDLTPDFRNPAVRLHAVLIRRMISAVPESVMEIPGEAMLTHETGCAPRLGPAIKRS
jgi:hypothetical protein